MIAMVGKQQIKKQTGADWKDILVWSVIVFIVVLGVYFNAVFQSYNLSLRVLVWSLLLACLSAVGMMVTANGQRFARYAQLAYIELLKVVWPTKQETTRMTGIVLVSVVFVSLFIWFIDTFLFWLLTMVTG